MWWVGWIVLILVSVRIFNKLTSGKCYADTVMTGKVVVVTGASGGLGYETALELAARGARVVLACRSVRRGIRAVERIKRRTNNPSVTCSHLDLTSLSSIRRFVERFKRQEAKLDVLVNNAGAVCAPRERTEDGIMKDMQINHFGPFLLTVLLVPMLRASAPSRVVVVSSAWHRLGRADHLNDDKCCYIQAYANSKLCNILFCTELARKLAGTGVVANCSNPGLVNTSLYRSSTFAERARSLALYAFLKRPEEGAQMAVQLAVALECEQVSGEYFAGCGATRAAAAARDGARAAREWARAAALVHLAPEEHI